MGAGLTFADRLQRRSQHNGRGAVGTGAYRCGATLTPDQVDALVSVLEDHRLLLCMLPNDLGVSPELGDMQRRMEALDG